MGLVISFYLWIRFRNNRASCRFVNVVFKNSSGKDDIDNVVQNNPMVFCPNPTITATENKSNVSYIPCSTDYITMKSLIEKTKIKKKYFWSKVDKPKVMAIPLNQFINTLKTSEEDNIKEIKVIPTPSSIKVINQINSKK